MAFASGSSERGVVPAIHHRRQLFAVGAGHFLFGVHVGGAFIFGALGHLRHGVNLVEQPAQENFPCPGSSDGEIAFGLHPDLVRRRCRQIVAHPRALERRRLCDDEFAMGFKTAEGGSEFFGLGQRDGAADAHQHAFDAGIAPGGIQRKHQIHHGDRPVHQRQRGAAGRIRQRIAHIQGQHRVARHAVAPHQPDDHQHHRHQHQQRHQARNAVQGGGENGTEPAEETHGESLSCGTGIL